MFQRTRIPAFVILFVSARRYLKNLTDSNFSLKAYSKRTRLFAILCLFRQTPMFGRNSSADFVEVVKIGMKYGFQGRKLNFRPGQIFATMSFCVSFLRCTANGWRYGKCGIRLLLNCLPTQMYIKISNVSTSTQTRICYSVCYGQYLYLFQCYVASSVIIAIN
jgi:hypothetical protein